MKTRLLTTGGLVVLAALGVAAQPQTPLQDGQTIPLWAEPAPGALGTDDSDIPAMTVFLPRTSRVNTPAVIVCPGGGYVRLATNHEGRQVANLAMSASTRFDGGNAGATDPVERAGSRPDFAVLGYPVISMTAAWTHQGSKTNLLGGNPDAELARSLSGELAVTRETPPTFLFHTNADTAVPAENSVHYFLALRKAGVPVEMHIFENGAHGVGLANDDAALSEWSKLLANWLRVRRVL